MSISSLASDLDSIIEGAGVAVTIGATSGFGVKRDEPVEAIGGSGELTVVGTQTTLTVREGKFSGLGADVAVVADGVNYVIRDPGKPKPDGTRKLVLVLASP
jgi:hypothetical protein